jgi:hypothetical protein
MTALGPEALRAVAAYYQYDSSIHLQDRAESRSNG